MVMAAGRSCVLGVDESRYQAPNNVGRLKTCRRFGVYKASGGDGGLYTDSSLWGHVNAAKGSLQRGAYHFLGNENPGEAQAERFMQATNGYRAEDFELPPTGDIETYGDHGQYRPSQQKVIGFITELHRLLPRRWRGPLGHQVAFMAYTGKPLENVLFPGIEIYDLWLAAYLNGSYPNPRDGVTNGCEPNVSALGSPDRYIPSPFKTWGGWQFAGGDGGAPGVGNERTGCDQDVWTDEMFNRLTGGATVGDWFDMADRKMLEDVVEEKLREFTGILEPDGPGGTNNLTRYHQDDRKAIIDGLYQLIVTCGMSSRTFRYQLKPEEGGQGDQWILSFTDAGPVRVHVPGDLGRERMQFALINMGAVNPTLIPLSKADFDVLQDGVREVPWNPDLETA